MRLCLLLGFFWTVALPAAQTLDVEVSDSTEIPITRYAAEGDIRVLWLPSEYGTQPAQARSAEALANAGIETWVADLHSAYFVPTGRAGMRAFKIEELLTLIETSTEPGKRLVLLSSGRGALLALRTARAWQTRHGADPALAGLILIHPHLYDGSPEAGQAAAFEPVVRATNLPVYLMQPALSGKYWHLQDAVAALAEGGAPVYQHPLPGVTDGFHLRPDEDLSPRDREARSQLPGHIARALKRLAATPTPAQAAPFPALAPHGPARPTAAVLKPYTQHPTPPLLALKDRQDRPHALGAYKGRVVLINFWASWCPPCVEEMPALNRLEQKLGKQPFSLLSVNVGEDRQSLEAFLKRIPVDFTILRDPRGTTIKDWKVYAYPSNYLIDARGRIRFAGFGALDWDAPETHALIQGLLDETHQEAQAGTRTEPYMMNRKRGKRPPG